MKEPINPMKTVDLQQEGGMQFSLRDFLYIIFKHKFKIIIIFLLFSILATAFVMIQPAYFQSVSRVLIKDRSASLSPDPSIVESMMGSTNVSYKLMSVELAIMESNELLKDVIKKIDIDNFFRLSYQQIQYISSLKQTVKDIIPYFSKDDEIVEKDLKLQAMDIIRDNFAFKGRDNILTLTYKSLDPVLAHDTLNVIVESYIERHIKILEPAISPDFFKKKFDESQKQLISKQNELKLLKENHNIFSLEDQKRIVVTQIGELKSRINVSNENLNASSAKIEYLEDYINNLSDTESRDYTNGLTSPSMEYLRQRLVEFRLKKAELVNKYPEDSRYILDINQQIQLTETSIEEEKKILIEQSKNNINMDTNSLNLSPENMLQNERTNNKEEKARLAVLTQQFQNLENEISELSEIEGEHNKIMNEIKLLEEENIQNQQNYQKSLLTATLENEKVSNLRLIQPPTLPNKPVGTLKERYRNIALGVFGGLIAGIVFAFILEYFKNTIKKNVDVENRLGLKVLASLSQIKIK